MRCDVAKEPLAAKVGLAFPLDPKELEERLWEIDKVSADDGDFEAAFIEVKSKVFWLRMAISRAATR